MTYRMNMMIKNRMNGEMSMPPSLGREVRLFGYEHSFSRWPRTSSPRIYRGGTCRAKGLWLPARGQRRNSGNVASNSRRHPLPRLRQCKRFRLDVLSKASSVYQRFHGAAERGEQPTKLRE